MKRRSFLAMLGLGSAASAMGQSEVYGGSSINQFVPTSGPLNYVEQSVSPLVDHSGHIKVLKGQLDAMLTDKETYIADRMKSLRDEGFSFHSGPVPYDLIAMKSFSEETKARLHLRRAAERDYERRKISILADINWFTENGNA